QLGNLQVCALTATPEVVSVPRTATLEQLEKPIDEILHVEPIADIRPVAINRHRYSVKSIQDSQRNKLFRKLIWAIIVRAIADDHWQSIGPVPSVRQVIGAGLAGRIRRAWLIWRILSKTTLPSQRAEDFVGRDVNEPELGATLWRQSLPILSCYFEKLISANDIGVNECSRVRNRTVDVAFCGEMQHCIRLKAVEDPVHCRAVADVRALHCVARIVRDCGERF